MPVINQKRLILIIPSAEGFSSARSRESGTDSCCLEPPACGEMTTICHFCLQTLNILQMECRSAIKLEDGLVCSILLQSLNSSMSSSLIFFS